MILKVKVVPRAKFNRIQKQEDGSWKIHTSAPAQDDKANTAVIEMLSDYFKVRKNLIYIVSGRQARNKVVEMDE